MKRKVKVEILSGLPGSGKSHYAKTQKQLFLDSDPWSKQKLQVIDMDEPRIYRPQMFDTFREHLIIDGLFLTTDEIIKIIKEVEKYSYNNFDLNFVIVRWKENRKACLHNDKNRRKKDSTITIKKAKFEYPDIQKIKDATGYIVNIVEKEIVKKPSSYNKIDHEIESHIQGDFLVSSSWILRGQSRSYDSDWNNIFSPISAEEIPEFDELYELLEKVCPSLTFLDSRYIFKHFVKIREFEENDYYSRTQNAQYICNLKELNEYLKEKGYLEEEEHDT